MPGFTSYDDLITQITSNGQATDGLSYKIGSTMQGAGTWHRTWIATGIPGAGSEPAATPGAAYTSNAAAVNFANVSTKQRFGISFGALSTQPTTLMLHDRLVGVGGISVASTGSKTVSSASLPRYTSGQNVQAWLEVTTATSTPAAVLTMNSYTGDVNGSGQTGAAITFPAAITVKDAALHLTLAAGDTGVQTCSTLSVGTAAGAGVVNFILLRPLVYLPLVANQWNERDLVLQIAALPRIFDGACLECYMLAAATTAQNIDWQLRTAYE